VKERKRTSNLAGILRFADGLDFTHSICIDDLQTRITPKKNVKCQVIHLPAKQEKQVELEKSDLLFLCFHRVVLINFYQ